MLLLRTAAIRRLEARHLPTAKPALMEQAGLAAADLASELANTLLGEVKQHSSIIVLAGSGNNGGDAYVCARHLKSRGYRVVVASIAPTQALPADADAARQAWLDDGGEIFDTLPIRKDFALAIDGLFGIGLSRPIESIAADWIDWLNSLHCPVLALDVPSGLNADSGAVMGRCVRASHTLTFIAAKPGLYTLTGRDHSGQVHCATLGIDAREEAAGEGRLISHSDFESALRPRLHDSHKGNNGEAAILGGAPGMAGAALLAGRAALHLGSGRVYLGMLDPLALDYGQPELMLRTVEDAVTQASVIGIGTGLGQSADALAALRLAIHCDKPLVLDADALNLIAAHPVLAARISRRPMVTALTPHPREAARLLECSTEDVQKDRIAAAQKLAQRFNAAVVLKGSGSVIAAPDGRWYINDTGNPGLASAGTGDVLLGIVAAFLAQGNDPMNALLAAVHVHGAAADALVAEGCGPVGLTAGELILPARRLWNNWIAGI